MLKRAKLCEAWFDTSHVVAICAPEPEALAAITTKINLLSVQYA